MPKEPVEWDLNEARALECRAGSLVLLHNAVVHYSAENSSAATRHAYSIHVGKVIMYAFVHMYIRVLLKLNLSPSNLFLQLWFAPSPRRTLLTKIYAKYRMHSLSSGREGGGCVPRRQLAAEARPVQ